MLIVYQHPGEQGWGPINHMVKVAVRAFGADLLVLAGERRPARWEQLRAIVSRRSGPESCLVVAPYPYDITAFLRAGGWHRRFGRMAAWIIDSFWVEALPRLSRHVRLFDHLFVTTEEDVATWSRMTGSPTSHLPWGTDALRLGSARADRTLDLLRVGRQPPEWEDDRVSEAACRRAGLRFAGRPPVPARPEDVQPALMARYAESRYVLAFSNAVNPRAYTHPVREYVTGRWVDALACGAALAGVAPASPDARRLLWPGATLELGGVERAEGLRVLAEAVRAWSPAQARLNHRNALERLDWRWRFEQIAGVLGESPPVLRAELEELRRRLDELDAGGPAERERAAPGAGRHA